MADNDLAIKVAKISKIYRIGLRDNSHDNLFTAIVDFIKSPLRNYRKYRSLYKFDEIISVPDGQGINNSDIIWALTDVSLEAKRGEVLGIIGRNGAGKSTLLKILSRITTPTRGRAEIRGRVSSLLEVGTGFHQELTGRENVYLNGTVLGMKKKEIDRKFDQIVDFSGVEKFIDTPVKRYSSGMKVRLAFSVAAHLEPEILIIDEVLAVGDAAFQKKCLDKMENVGREGRTVLFVSHNMPAVTRLCDRVILLDHGKVIEDGPSQQVVSSYLNSGFGTTGKKEWSEHEDAPGSHIARLKSVAVVAEDGSITDVLDIRQPFTLRMEYEVLKPGYWLLPNFNIYNEQGLWVFTTMDQDPSWRRRPRPAGRYVSTAHVPGNLLAEGTLFVEPAMMTPEPFIRHFRERDVIAFHVVDSLEGDSARGDFRGDMGGVVRPLLDWTTDYSLESKERDLACPEK
jgi:lipopolysaccharide transport system ATP-binding protein